MEITLEHLPAADTWRATYRFAEPVQAAHFRRPGYGLRSRYWRVVTPATVRIDHTLGEDVGFSSTDGAPFREVVVEVPAYDSDDSDDYALFNRFTDGSMLVYTGHFDVVPFVCRRSSGCAGARDLEEAAPKENNGFVLLPRASERVVLQGRAQAGRASWDSDGEGAWAYFGAITPQRSPQLVALLDPGLPPWLRTKLEQLLPDIFTYYADRTGQTLHPLPVVYLNFNPLPSEKGVGIGGGTRVGNVQLVVDLGKAYVREPSPGALERIGFLFAHEGAHLWNNQMFAQDDDRNDWLHEGGADAFAFRAMLHFGVITRERYEEELSEALSTCVLALGGGPIREMGKSGRYEGYYPCGSTIALWTEAAVARAHPGLDLFDFWKRIFADARGQRGGHYDDALYEGLLASLAGEEVAGAVRSLVEEAHPDAEAFLTRELGKVGLTVTDAAPQKLPVRYDELAGRWALEALAKEDCGGSGRRVSANEGALDVLDATGCKHLASGIQVTKMGAFDVKAQGARAFDYVVAQCRQGGEVELQAKGAAGLVKVPCHAALAARGGYRQVAGAPPVR